MKKRRLRRFSFGLLSVFVALACIFTGCPTDNPESARCAVTFDAGDGVTAPANQTVEEGKKVTKPVEPIKEGYKVANWYKEAPSSTYGHSIWTKFYRTGLFTPSWLRRIPSSIR
ncbi:MAG: InlB B-repeat-containing protein [Treponema sp.]|jgi:hypothetical protein|nr:InlB B-repeat-containing protein [Treponema sp.]